MKFILTLLFPVVFALVSCNTTAPVSTTIEASQMSNKDVAARFFDQFSNGDIDAAFGLVSDDVAWWVPGDLPFSGTKTKAQYMQIVGSIQNGFPNGLKLDATSMIAEGDKVAVEVSSFGEHVNGKTYTNTYHFLMTMENGQITEVKEYMDTLHLFQLIQP